MLDAKEAARILNCEPADIVELEKDLGKKVAEWDIEDFVEADDILSEGEEVEEGAGEEEVEEEEEEEEGEKS
jgi:hypothetical protein